MSSRPALPNALVCLALGIGAAGAGAARAETLQDAVALAYQTNPGLQSQRAALRALDENDVQARAGYGPTVTASIEETANQLYSGAPKQALSTTTTVLNFSQPLFTGGRINARIAAADANIMAGRERLRSSEIQLIQRVIDAYVAVRRDQALVKVYADQVTVLDQERRETEQRFAVRDVTRTDVAQAQGRLAAAQSQLATIEANLAISRAQYLDAVGQNPGDLAPEPELPLPAPDLDTTIGVAEQNSPVLRTARFTELASRAQVTEAKAEFNPSVGLQITGQRLPSSTLLPSPQIEAVTSALTLTQPLFSGGLRVSALRQARAQNDSDKLAADNAQRTLIDNVAQSWNQVVSARKALTADDVQVDATQTAFEGERQEERVGLRSTIEVLNALQELIAAQAQVVRDRYNAYAAQTALLAASGLLEAKAIVPDVEMFDPDKDLRRAKQTFLMPWTPALKLVDNIPYRAPHGLAPLIPSAHPDEAPPLPPPPTPAAKATPIRSAAQIMADTTRKPKDASDAGAAPSAGGLDH